MKNKKTIRMVSLTLAIALSCSLAACKSSGGEEAASSSEASASSVSKTEILSTLTDQELQELISGEATIEQIAEQRAAAAQGSAPSGSIAETPAASDGTAPSTETPDAAGETPDGSAASSSSSAATTEEPAYEAEIRGLINQLYGIQSKAQSGLNSAINAAKAEYKALPAEKQTQAKKISICMGKAGQLKALESECDNEVSSIVSQMRKVLSDNGQSTALADQAMNTYKSEKNAMYSSLMSQLYG